MIDKIRTVKILTMILAACMGTACQSTFKIQTKPEGAEIYAGDTLLGKAPLTISADQIPTKMAGGVMLQIRNAGYKNINVWLPNGSYNTDYLLNLTPFYERSDSVNSIDDNAIERAELYILSDLLLTMQNSLLHGDAVKDEDVKMLLETNPTLGSSHFLAAMHALRQKKAGEVLVLLKDAVRYSPAESDFLALFNEVKAENGKK